jgi:hypothetical protein
MSQLLEAVARAIYRVRPAIQPWDGEPFDFDEPRAQYERDLAYRQARAVAEDVLGDGELCIFCNLPRSHQGAHLGCRCDDCEAQRAKCRCHDPEASRIMGKHIPECSFYLS